METTENSEFVNPMKNASRSKRENFNTNPKNNTSFIKKCSLFDTKQSEQLLGGIVEVVEGFQHDFDTLNQSRSETTALKQEQRTRNSLESLLTKNLSVTDKLFCTTCNYTLSADREEQVK